MYTGDRQNLRVEGGRLVITARREAGGDRGQRITSARIRTFGRFQVAPCAEYPTVKIKARIRLPSGEGDPAGPLRPRQPLLPPRAGQRPASARELGVPAVPAAPAQGRACGLRSGCCPARGRR